MKIPIEFESGGFNIKGNFHLSTGRPPYSTILLLSGFPGNENDVLGLGERLSQHDINTATFNYRGIYQSQGSHDMENSLEDIQAAINYLHQPDVVEEFDIDLENIVLGGWSFGGGMALAFAAQQPSIRRILSIAGTDHGEFAREYERNAAFGEVVDIMFDELRRPTGPVEFEGKEVIKKLLQNRSPYDLRRLAPSLADRDLLLIGGWDDLNVTIEGHILPFYRALVTAEARSVRITALNDGHRFERSRERLTSTIVSWVKTQPA